jgi:hypothetical protein
MGAALSQPELLDHPGRSQRPLRNDRLDRTQTVLLRAALSELQRLESLPMVHFISLSLRPFLAPCACSVSALLQFSSELHYQSYNAQSPPPKPLEELHRCSPSVCDHFVKNSARVPLPLTVTVQHRLLPRANVSRMYAECFDKVLYHVNSRILKCKMTNVITRLAMDVY